MNQHIISSLQEAAEGLNALMQSEKTLQSIADVGALMASTLRQGGRIFSCGNGGSLCDAMHFAEELSGKYRNNRKALAAVAIADSGHLSCTANDFGYEFVFSRYLEAHGRPGDILLAISTSGKSPNVLEAAKQARTLGMKVVALTGLSQNPLASMVDLQIATPAGKFADRVQELHIKVIHILIELIERDLFPENYGV
jgi:D-sedoheptulose 7-phosphate isomerase